MEPPRRGDKMSEVKLKPCPFCGKNEISIWCADTVNHMTRYMIGCECGARMNGIMDEDKENVIERWNRRAGEEKP
jgi:Lar family restriction alleviation protein